MKFEKTCKIPGGPTMILIERLDVIGIIFCKLAFAVVILLTVLGTAGYFIEKYRISQKPHWSTTHLSVDAATAKVDQLRKDIRRGNAMINQANYRMANRNILSALFQIPYPKDNTYSLEKFSIRAYQTPNRVSSQPAPSVNGVIAAAPSNKEVSYSFELSWKASNPEATNKIQELSKNVISSMRPDFSNPTMLPWNINLKTDQQKSSVYGGLYDNRVSGDTQPPVTSKPFELLKGKTESDRASAIRSYYNSQQINN